MSMPWGVRLWMALVLAFLYLPVAALVLAAVNDTTLPGQWGGFTWRWFKLLAHDHELLGALVVSLGIALCTATGATLLGTLAALALVRHPQLAGHTLLLGLLSAPLMLPRLVLGLSMLLMLVSVQHLSGWPERGWMTIWLGHLLVGMAYATVLIQARLRTLDPGLEEAALDLGARPWQAFRLVTLPQLWPSVLSSWLLTFTLSMDDVVLAAFLAGPGATTLPLVVFARARQGLDPSVNALATVVLAVVAVGVVLAAYWLARQDARRRPV
ncbi:ABC transporter permease [Aquabacterium sp. A3]|uniref:ABC transporter permease n=1 Tax=Aquabacterium sp. A3 TaxID=3132829 RepID=UPI0031197083